MKVIEGQISLLAQPITWRVSGYQHLIFRIDVLIGLNYILLCLNNSSQIAKMYNENKTTNEQNLINFVTVVFSVSFLATRFTKELILIGRDLIPFYFDSSRKINKICATGKKLELVKSEISLDEFECIFS